MSFLSHPLASISDPAFWSGLGAIILIDLVLAGDNAVVIALAARDLPHRLQLRAIFWGSFIAVAVRIGMTAGVLWLLKIPGLMLIGGLVLLPIAWRLLHHHEERPHVRPAASLWSAMFTIVLADALMGLDNVLAIAGASKGHLGLVALGLLISVPLVVWGSTLLLKLLTRWAAIVYVGAGVIAWTAARMVTEDDLVDDWFDAHMALDFAVLAVFVIGVLALGLWTQRRDRLKHLVDDD